MGYSKSLLLGHNSECPEGDRSSKAMMINPKSGISSHGTNMAISVDLEQVIAICDTIMLAKSKIGAISCKSRFQDENHHQLATELRS